MMYGGRNKYDESIMQARLKDVRNWDDADLIAMFDKQVDMAMMDPDNGYAWFDLAVGYFFAITNSMERARNLAMTAYFRMTS